MASNRSYTVIGAFLLGAIALLAVGILAFGGSRIFSNQRQAIIFFDQSVLGLSSGSRVLFRGVQIGTVKNVQLRLDPDASKARIAVTVDITGNDVVMLNGAQTPASLTVPQLVQRGLRAQLVVYSYVTSQLAVNLDFQPETRANFIVDPSKLELPEIPAVPSEIAQLKDTVAKIPWKKTLDTVNQTMSTVLQLSQDLDRTINTLGPSLTQTSDSTQQTLAALRDVIRNNNQQLSATIKSVQTLSDTASHAIVARDKQIDALLANAQQTSSNLNQLSQNLNNVADPDSDTRREIQTTLRDLSATAASLRRFSETIERDPHALLYGGRPD